MDNIPDELPADVIPPFEMGDGDENAKVYISFFKARDYTSGPKCYVTVKNCTDYSQYQKGLIEKMENADARYKQTHEGEYAADDYYPVFEAGLLSPIVITADCALFGRAAGDNLADLFIVKESDDTNYLRSYGDFAVLAYLPEAFPMRLDEFLRPGVLIPKTLFISVPFKTETAVQFHLSMHVETVSYAHMATVKSKGFMPTEPTRNLFFDFTIEP